MSTIKNIVAEVAEATNRINTQDMTIVSSGKAIILVESKVNVKDAHGDFNHGVLLRWDSFDAMASNQGRAALVLQSVKNSLKSKRSQKIAQTTPVTGGTLKDLRERIFGSDKSAAASASDRFADIETCLL